MDEGLLFVLLNVCEQALDLSGSPFSLIYENDQIESDINGAAFRYEVSDFILALDDFIFEERSEVFNDAFFEFIDQDVYKDIVASLRSSQK